MKYHELRGYETVWANTFNTLIQGYADFNRRQHSRKKYSISSNNEQRQKAIWNIITPQHSARRTRFLPYWAERVNHVLPRTWVSSSLEVAQTCLLRRTRLKHVFQRRRHGIEQTTLNCSVDNIHCVDCWNPAAVSALSLVICYVSPFVTGQSMNQQSNHRLPISLFIVAKFSSFFYTLKKKYIVR